MVIDTTKVGALLHEVLLDTRKISKTEVKEEDFKDFLSLINGLNSLKDTQSSYKGVPLDEIKLPNWCKPLLTPMKISVGTDWYYADLIKRSKDQSQYPDYDEESVMRLSRRVAKAFKSDVQVSSFNDLRPGVMPLSSCQIAVKGNVRQNGTELFYPIQLKRELNPAFGEEFFNMEESRMIEQFFRRQFKFF